MDNNCLSGFTPLSFQATTNIIVMEGNLFDCNSFNPASPHDPNTNKPCVDLKLMMIL